MIATRLRAPTFCDIFVSSTSSHKHIPFRKHQVPPEVHPKRLYDLWSCKGRAKVGMIVYKNVMLHDLSVMSLSKRQSLPVFTMRHARNTSSRVHQANAMIQMMWCQ